MDQTLPTNTLLEHILTPPLGTTNPSLTTLKRLLPEYLMRGQPLCSELLPPPSNHDLSHLPLPPSLMPLGNYPSPMPLTLSLTITPTMSLCFESPKPLSLGMRTARMWHQEQLLEAQKKHNLKNRRRHQAGLLPLARCHHLISDSALNVMAQENIATATNLQPPFQSQHQSPLPLSQHHPLAPSQWDTFVSLMKKPCPWRTTLPTPSKSVVKIPLKYRLPTPKEPRLPKGWVYNVAEVKEEDLANPSLYTTPTRPLTCTMCSEVAKHCDDPYRRLHKGTSTT
jgi:hypothetical protein